MRCLTTFRNGGRYVVFAASCDTQLWGCRSAYLYDEVLVVEVSPEVCDPERYVITVWYSIIRMVPIRIPVKIISMHTAAMLYIEDIGRAI